MREEKREIGFPQIIQEDVNFFIVNKPSGWVTNDADTAVNQPVLQKYMRENFDYPLATHYEHRNGIVHRLDKETSGIVLVAKNEETFFYLQSLFKERKVKKGYLALLHGELKEQRGIVEAEVGRLPWNRRRFGIIAGGRHSLTRYRVRSIYKKDDIHYSLVEFFPETGRTHQIRIHAKHIGHPIVSDEFYAGRKTSRKDRIWCDRLFLHAYTISFPDKHGETVTATSELPNDLANSLALLEMTDSSD